MDGTLWRYQKVAMGLKKWVKNTAKLSFPTAQQSCGILTLVDKDKKIQIRLNNCCKIESMPAQYKNRDHTFEVTCAEEKVHLLAADNADLLLQWLSKMHDVARLRKDHLFGGGGGGDGGGGCGGGGSVGSTTGGGGVPEIRTTLEVEAELQDNLLYDSCDNKTFPVTIKANSFTDSLNLHGSYTLQLDSMKLSLIEPTTGKNLFSWPYRYLRRYGREKTSFSMEVGRRCTSGEGLIRFNVQDGNQVFHAIQEYVSAMTGRSFSTNSAPTTPPTAPQGPPVFNPVPTELKTPKVTTTRTAGVKVLPTGPTGPKPRDRTHSAGSRNSAPKPATRGPFSNRGAQSVDDVSRSEPLEESYSAVSDETVDRSKKLPSPKSQRSPAIDFEPEQHYDVATEPVPKQWPQIPRRETSGGKSNGVRPAPTPRALQSSSDKTVSKVDTLNSGMSAVVLDDSSDPGFYSSLDQPPGSVGATAADGQLVYSEAEDHDHIYDHLARQKVGNPSAAPRLPPPNNKPVVAPKAVPVAAKPVAQEDNDMLYDHLDRGQTGTTQPGNSPVGAVPEDAYDILSLDVPSGGSPGESGYLVSSYQSSTVPEESEYAEANDQNFGYDDNPYEVA